MVKKNASDGSAGHLLHVSVSTFPAAGAPCKKHWCKWFIMPPVDSEMGGLVSISSQIAATLQNVDKAVNHSLSLSC